MAKKIAAGNWKMNGLMGDLPQIDAIAAAVPTGITALICPPALLVAPAAARTAGTALRIGGQTCHSAAKGAHTGEISANMLRDAGADAVILGHSERRQDQGETDADIAAKISAAQSAGLQAIFCVGESEATRDAGHALAHVADQITAALNANCDAQQLMVAYEPIWAIGTGKTATPVQISEMHAHIRATLAGIFGDTAQDVPLLYGGSVNATNAAEIFACPNVDGALVGGASLTADNFIPIMQALAAA